MARFTDNESGAIAVYMAVALTAIMAVVAFALDFSQLHTARKHASLVGDATALSAALAALENEEDRQALGKSAYDANTPETSGYDFDDDATIVFDDTKNEVTVTVGVDVDLMFFSNDSRSVSFTSSAHYGLTAPVTEPTSVVFVLDVSGSMWANISGQSRIVLLKDTMEDIFEELDSRLLDEPDLESKVKTGLFAYNAIIRDEYTVELADGWADTKQSVDDMTTGLGTVPSHAMEAAYQSILAGRPEGGVADRREIILFMTDGEIDDHLAQDGENFTENTLATCANAKADGIEIFAVGIGAPGDAQAVLEECASESGEYEHDDSSQNSAPPSYYTNAIYGSDFVEFIAQVVPETSQKVEVYLSN